MENLRDRIDEVWASLLRQLQVSKNPNAELGAVQQEMVVQLIAEYLKHGDDATVRAAHSVISPLQRVTIGDAISVLDVMRSRWTDSPETIGPEDE